MLCVVCTPAIFPNKCKRLIISILHFISNYRRNSMKFIENSIVWPIFIFHTFFHFGTNNNNINLYFSIVISLFIFGSVHWMRNFDSFSKCNSIFIGSKLAFYLLYKRNPKLGKVGDFILSHILYAFHAPCFMLFIQIICLFNIP